MDFQICVLVQHMCCYLGVISPLFRHTTVIYTSHLNDEVPEPVIPRYSAQFVHTTEDPTQCLARLERELSLKEKEDELETRKLKLEREEKKRAKQTSKPTCSPQVLELLEQMVKGDKADFQ